MATSYSTARFGVSPDADVSKFQCIYPIYLDKTKTIAQGRRLPLSIAVPYPNIAELVNACSGLRLPIVAEARKTYSRDFLYPGRLRFQLRHPVTNELYNTEIPNKYSFMVRLATVIGANKDRKPVDPVTAALNTPIAPTHAAMASMASAAAKEEAATASSAASKKKKGKK